MAKNVYFSQPNFKFGEEKRYVFFPFAAGVLAAYAWQSEIIKNNCNLGGFIYRLNSAKKQIGLFKDPWLVGFSNYLWNYKNNLELCEKLKKKYPECIMVFGGHHIPDNTSFLEKHSFIDVLIHGNGEIPFTQLLEALIENRPLDDVANISFRKKNGEIVKTERKCVVIEDYPSPYLEGLFDSLFENKPKDIVLNMILETSRGCPNSCSYCDWSDRNTKVKAFPLEKVFAEIDWMVERGIDYCYCTDSNFGILKRDEEIVERVVESKKKTGLPNTFVSSFTRSKRAFNIHKMLNKYNLCKGAILSTQSLSNQSLGNVKRKDISIERYADLFEQYRNAGINTYPEMILGLPGETYGSFRDGLCKLLDLGQHSSFYVFNCEVFPNAEMGQEEYQEKHGIRYVDTPLNFYHFSPFPPSVQTGLSSLVIETSTMSEIDWKKTHLFTHTLRAFHNLGYLQLIAIYLHYEKNVLYVDFYESLMAWIKDNPSSVANYGTSVVEKTLDLVTQGESALNYLDKERFGNFYWPLEEAVFLRVSLSHNEFYDEIEGFISQFFEDNKEDRLIFDELLKYQKNIVKFPNRKNVVIDLKHNYYQYFNNIYANNYQPLKEERIKVRFDNSGIPSNISRYAKKMVWNRRAKSIFNEKIEVELI